MIVWKPAVYTAAGLSITVPALPDLKNSMILAVGSAWVTGNISPNPVPYINGISFSRNSTAFTAVSLAQENGIVGETSRLSLASACAYQADPDPGTYNISIALDPQEYTSYGLAGAMALFVYNAEYATYDNDTSVGSNYTSATVAWSSPDPGSVFIGSCICGDGGYSSDVIYPTPSGGGAGEKIDLGTGTYGQAGTFGGGGALSVGFSFSSARYAAVGIGASPAGIAPWFF